MKFILVIIGLIFFSWNLHAQDETARYCEFTNLQLSPDSTALIFNIDYFEEGESQSTTPIFLGKKLTTGKITCFNPQPLRFSISGNKRYLLFSALYGIFIQELTDSSQCRQLTFFDPTSDEYLREMGFFAADSGVFWITENYDGEIISQIFFRIQKDSSTGQSATKFLKIPIQNTWKKSSLPVADPNSGQKSEFKLANQRLRYLITPRTGADYDLSDIAFQKSVSSPQKIILSKIRPWLISICPAEKWILFSGWQKVTGEFSWLNLAGTDSLRKIDAGSFKFVSWIDSSAFFGLNKAGLIQYSTDSLAAKSLHPLCSLNQDSFFTPDSTQIRQNEIIIGDRKFTINNTQDVFKRSRIWEINQITGDTTVFVPEMSNLDKKW